MTAPACHKHDHGPMTHKPHHAGAELGDWWTCDFPGCWTAHFKPHAPVGAKS